MWGDIQPHDGAFIHGQGRGLLLVGIKTINYRNPKVAATRMIIKLKNIALIRNRLPWPVTLPLNILILMIDGRHGLPVPVLPRSLFSVTLMAS